MSALTTSIHHHTGMRQEKEIKNVQIEKKEIKLSLFEDCLCRKSQRIDKENLLGLVNNHSKVADKAKYAKVNCFPIY